MLARFASGPLERLRNGTDEIGKRYRAAPRPVRVGLVLVGLAFLVVLPYIKIPVLNTPDSDFASVLFFPIGVYVLLAIGLNVVVGLAGLLDLGYVAFFAIGGYAMALLGVNAGLSFYEILPVAIAASMLAGVILGSPTLRLRGDYLAIVTLGFGEIVRITANNSNPLGGPRGIFGIPHPPTTASIKFSLLDPKPYYWLLLVFIVLMVLMVRRLERSRVGRAWTTIREDQDAAELMGVPTFKFKLWAFAIGAGIGGLGGCLYASKVVSITPDNYTFLLSILVLAAVVLGGVGNLPGVIVGAIIVAYLPERFRTFSEARYMIFGAALVATMIFRPQGLLPSRRRASELTENIGLGGMGSLGGEIGHLPPREVGEVPKMSPEPLLVLDDVTMHFGGVSALSHVSIRVDEGEIAALIGPNGAGKTTVFNVVTGVFHPTSGFIRFEGQSIVGLKRYEVTKAGIARTFQNIRLFANMTAIENVMVGADARHTTSVPGAVLHLPKYTREENEGEAKAREFLELVGISHRAGDLAKNLSYGDQRRLEIARALGTGPRILLLDEPAAGFNPAEKRALMALIRKVRDSGYTVLLIEHDMGLVMQVSDRIMVLDFGQLIAEGQPAEIQTDERVIAAYLGTPADAS